MRAQRSQRSTMGEKMWLSMHPRNFGSTKSLACEQGLKGALAAGQEKEGELATTSLEFECLHSKSRCDMLIGGDDVSNDVITLGKCFLNVCLPSHSFSLRADWRKSESLVDGGATERWNSNSRDT